MNTKNKKALWFLTLLITLSTAFEAYSFIGFGIHGGRGRYGRGRVGFHLGVGAPYYGSYYDPYYDPYYYGGPYYRRRIVYV